MEILLVRYNIWKQIQENNSFKIYHIKDGEETRLVYSGNLDYIFKTQVVDSDFSDYEISYENIATEIFSEDEAKAVIVGLGKLVQKQYTSDGRLAVAISAPEGDKLNIVSFNFCDKTSWYVNSTRVENEIASPNIDFSEYSLSHDFIIDSYHGKIFHEDFLKDSEGNSYRVIVKVNEEIKTERDPHYGDNGDYEINYISGKILFFAPLQETDIVSVTYYFATDSLFIVKPPDKKVLRIKSVECQFSEDIVMTDGIEYGGFGYAGVFAPAYVPVPYALKDIIQLGNPERYKTMMEIVSDANGNYPELPALGGNTWRGCPQKIFTFPWNYTATTKIVSDYGMEIRIKLLHDTPFLGTFCTITFYTMVTDN